MVAMDNLSFVIGEFCNCGTIVSEGVTKEYPEIALQLKWHCSDTNGGTRRRQQQHRVIACLDSNYGGPQA